LHNTATELAAKDIEKERSLQIRQYEGTRANTNINVDVQKTKKLSLSAYVYRFNRLSNVTYIRQQVHSKI